MKKLRLAFAVAATVASAVGAAAQDYPAPKEGDWVARDFRFHTGEVTPDLRIHYTTIGEPSGQPVLILHGTTQSGTAMLSPTFAGELFTNGIPTQRDVEPQLDDATLAIEIIDGTKREIPI